MAQGDPEPLPSEEPADDGDEASPAAEEVPLQGEVVAEGEEPKKRNKIAGWIERRAEKAIKRAVSSGAESIEQRATTVIGTVYDEKASDLEERAVRALRTAIHEETDRIRATIEHSVEVKKREVRLSLLVLVGAAVVYLVLYWLTGQAPAAE